jgi:hypothetical protein
MSKEYIRQSIIDEEHLKLLSLGYMISAGITAFSSLFAPIYVAMGIMISLASPEAAADAGEEFPAFVGLVFAGIGLAIFLFMIALAAAKFWVALCIKRRKSRTFCMIVAGISCLGIPYGTLLGVLSFIVLGRTSVAQLFSSKVVS